MPWSVNEVANFGIFKRFVFRVVGFVDLRTPAQSKMRFLLFSVAIALLGCALGDEILTEENVYVLGKSNFDTVLSENEFVLVEFCKFLDTLFTKLTNNPIFSHATLTLP